MCCMRAKEIKNKLAKRTPCRFHTSAWRMIPLYVKHEIWEYIVAVQNGCEGSNTPSHVIYRAIFPDVIPYFLKV